MINNPSILIKPASYLCNLDCTYCFYKKESKANSKIKGIKMDEHTLNNLISKILKESNNSITFTFQGGEPLLVGLSYYQNFITLVNKYNINNLKIFYTIQTNGLLIDESWAKFFKENNFLVGISYDGTKKIHDLYRANSANKVLEKINILKENKVEFNILSVISKELAKRPKKVYLENKNNNFKYLQFIPIIADNTDSYSLRNKDYLYFLKKMFKYWYKDILNNNYWYCRYFDSLLLLVANKKVYDCTLEDKCSKMYCFEADGSCFPCDFYMIDDYYLGNINDLSFKEIDENLTKSNFLLTNKNIKCQNCKYNNYCHGGCKKLQTNDNNLYCKATYSFLKFALIKLNKLKKSFIER